jgi:enoyl-CoA hydratase
LTAHLSEFFQFEQAESANLLRLVSPDGTNRLTTACVVALTEVFEGLSRKARPVVITGNHKFFSVGADLNEIAALSGPDAYQFSAMGQALMNCIAGFPAVVIAAVEGHCMGGGFDLALACHQRIASPHAVFGHRGAALGLMTGWGGTQRLPRLIGKGRAIELFVAAEKIMADRAFEIGLVDLISNDPVAAALAHLQAPNSQHQ